MLFKLLVDATSLALKERQSVSTPAIGRQSGTLEEEEEEDEPQPSLSARHNYKKGFRQSERAMRGLRGLYSKCWWLGGSKCKA